MVDAQVAGAAPVDARAARRIAGAVAPCDAAICFDMSCLLAYFPANRVRPASIEPGAAGRMRLVESVALSNLNDYNPYGRRH